jgi:hypothetical protein
LRNSCNKKIQRANWHGWENKSDFETRNEDA